jgi:AcrR family transcriptional regulator
MAENPDLTVGVHGPVGAKSPTRGKPSSGRQASRRERRISARQDAILAAAARLFAEKGYHRTTTKEIADAADVSEGTIYKYFASKDELLLGIMAHLSEQTQLGSRLTQSLPDDARQFFISMLKYRQNFVEQNYNMLKATLSEILVNPELSRRYYDEMMVPSLAQLEEHIQARIELGQVRPVDRGMAARMIIAVAMGLFLLRSLGDPLLQPPADGSDHLPEEVASFFFDGLRAG